MESKQILEFKEPKNWVLGEKKIQVSKIETSTHEWEPTVPKSKILEVVEPNQAIRNIIKNVGLLPNASFLEMDQNRIIARIQDLTGNTLIRTQWIIPKTKFNEVVTLITIQDKIPEYKFHIVSKIS